MLADHFVKKYAAANGVPAPALDPQAVARLVAHSWRGNVRELENCMHRAVLLAVDGRIGGSRCCCKAARGLPRPGPAARPRSTRPRSRPTAAADGTAAAGYPAASPTYPNAAAYGAYAQRQPQPPPAGRAGRRRALAAGDTGCHATAGLVGRTVAEVERELILDTLEHTLGNRTHAANILGISIRTLRNKLRSLHGRRHPGARVRARATARTPDDRRFSARCAAGRAGAHG